MHILIAPNAFKNSLDAGSVATAISEGLQESRLVCTAECFPIGDGGDGTGALFAKHLGGKRVSVMAHDAIGRPIQSSFWLIDNDQTAVIELADTSGLRQLEPGEYDPLYTTTKGTGEMIKLALDLNVKKIILTIGGSATVDGGTGILEVLGILFLDGKKKPVDLPNGLAWLSQIDLSGLDPRIMHIDMILLCDVENPLLGAIGAATVFGPQKGARDHNIPVLESMLSRFREVSLELTGKDMATIKYGGAAGGVAAGLGVFLNAKLVSGIEYFLDHTGFEKSLDKANLLITAEGSLDHQTTAGKGPMGTAKRAKLKGIPVIGFAGKVPLEQDQELSTYFDVVLPIGHGPMELSTAMKTTAINLSRTAKAVGNLLSLI
jgi:glycerate kinase